MSNFDDESIDETLYSTKRLRIFENVPLLEKAEEKPLCENVSSEYDSEAEYLTTKSHSSQSESEEFSRIEGKLLSNYDFDSQSSQDELIEDEDNSKLVSFVM